MNENLGQYLRRKRESHLISMQEISVATGISVPMLKAIEENDFQLIPQPEMTVKYLRRYAAYLGLDKKDVLRRYQTQCEVNDQKRHLFPHLSLFSDENSSFTQTKGGKRFFKKRAIRGLFLSGIILLVIIIIYLCVNVMPLKTGVPESREKVTSKEPRSDVSRERIERRSSAVPEKTGRSPDHSSPVPSRNIIPLERDKEKKESGARAKIAPQLAGDGKVVGNRDSKLYHMPGMKYYHKIKSYHRVTFKSEAEAIKAGYSKARE